MIDRIEKRPWGGIALITAPLLVVLGSASGWLSNSGYGNRWFAALVKPAFMPPGWLFGIVWPILYALMGIALAMILALLPSPRRRNALTLFFVQLALNFGWSPIFFAGHDIELARIVIIAMTAIAAAAAGQFFRLNRVAGLLLTPYLAWLIFAATLNAAILNLNPGAGSNLLGLREQEHAVREQDVRRPGKDGQRDGRDDGRDGPRGRDVDAREDARVDGRR